MSPAAPVTTTRPAARPFTAALPVPSSMHFLVHQRREVRIPHHGLFDELARRRGAVGEGERLCDALEVG